MIYLILMLNGFRSNKNVDEKERNEWEISSAME